jgi:hypothetical protein
VKLAETEKKDEEKGIPELKDEKKILDNQTDHNEKDEKVKKEKVEKDQGDKKNKEKDNKDKKDKKKRKKNVDQWWRTYVKSQWGGMLTEELIIEYDLDEEEAASAWMEAVQMVFKDLAMFIEYNHSRSTRNSRTSTPPAPGFCRCSRESCPLQAIPSRTCSSKNASSTESPRAVSKSSTKTTEIFSHRPQQPFQRINSRDLNISECYTEKRNAIR